MRTCMNLGLKMLSRKQLTVVLVVLWMMIGISCASKQTPTLPKESGSTESSVATDGPAYLGILYMETMDGVMVSEVYADSPASKAGLRPYDLIVAANGYPVIGQYTLKERILSLKPGTQVEIEILSREGGRTLKRVILEPMPDRFKIQPKKEGTF